VNYSPRLFPAPRHLPAFVCSQIIRNSSPASKRAFHHSPCPARCHLAGKSHTKALEFPSLFSSGCALFHFPYPASLLFATLTETTGVCTNSSHSGTRHYRWTPVPPLPCLPLFPIHYPLSPLFSYSCALFCTFLHASKTQLFSFQAIPHSLPKNTRGWGTLPRPWAQDRPDASVPQEQEFTVSASNSPQSRVTSLPRLCRGHLLVESGQQPVKESSDV